MGNSSDQDDKNNSGQTIRSAGGNAVLTGTSGGDSIYGGAGDDKISAGAGNDYVDGGSGNDIIDGGIGNDRIDGGSGNDTITGGAGNDVIDGGAGLDVAVFSGKFSDYKLTLSKDGGHSGAAADDTSAMTVHDMRSGSPDGVDVLKNVEVLKFTDGEYYNGRFYPSGGNHAPTGSATAVLATGTEDTPYTVTQTSLIAGFTDVDGDSLSVSGLSASNGASVTLNADGISYTITPAANYNGPITLSYNVIDGHGGTIGATQHFNLAPVNDAPFITSAAAASVAENSSGTVYTATATDVDSAPPTYSLSGTDALLFNIDSTTGAVSFKVSPNFEAPADAGANNVYDINVIASDGSLSTSKAVAISVTNVNEAPVITSAAAASVAENTSGTVYTATATDVDSAPPTYSLSGTDAALFNIDSTTGAVSFKVSPNFEAPADAGANNVYDINVIASDGSLSTAKAVAISVTNVNEAPVITSAAAASVAENSSGTVYTATATDVDSAPPTYSLSGTDALLFNIDSTTGAVSFKVSPNFEAPADAGANNVYDINVIASDGSLSATQAVVISVTDVDEEPTPNNPAIISGTTSSTVVEAGEEGPGVPTATGQLTSIDIDENDPDNTFIAVPTAALSAGGYGSFTITADGLWTYELDNSNPFIDALNSQSSPLTDTFTVYSFDGTAQLISVSISGANDAPVVSSVSLGEILEDTPVTIITAAQLFAGVVNVDGPSLAVTSLSLHNPSQGTLTDNGDNTWSFTPTLNSDGEVKFDFTVSDGQYSGNAEATLLVNAVADAPRLQLPSPAILETPDAFLVAGAAQLEQGARISTLSDGTTIVAWMVQRADGVGSDIHVRHANTAGVLLGEEVLVTTDAGMSSQFPAIAALDDGGFVVAWTAQHSSGYDIFAQKFGASPATPAQMGGPIQVTGAGSLANDLAVSVSALSDSGFVVVWQGGDSETPNNIFATVFQGSDVTPVTVTGTLSVSEFAPSVSTLADGTFVVVWHETSEDFTGTIYGRHYQANGTPIGTGAFEVSTTGSNSFASVAALAGGGFVTIWQSDDGPSTNIYARQFDAHAEPVAEAVAVTASPFGNHQLATVAGLSDGGYAIVWRDETAGVVTAQSFTSSDQPVGQPFQVHVNDSNEYLRDFQPSIAALPNAAFIVTWSHEFNSDNNIWARTFTPYAQIKENQNQPLSFKEVAELIDTDGSEILSSITLSGLPEGVLLMSHGQSITVDNGTATVTSDDLADLTLHLPPGSDISSFVLTLTATSTEVSGQLSVDSSTASLTFGVTVVPNQAPVIDLDTTQVGTGYSTTFMAGQSGPVAVASAHLAVSDPDNSMLASATVTLVDAQPGDALVISGSLPTQITATVFGATVTLTGAASSSAYNSALQAIRFDNSNATPGTETRQVSIVVNDGADDSNIAYTTIDVLPFVNHAPVAIDSGIWTNSGTSATWTLTGQDQDIGAQLTYFLGTDASFGTLALDADGTYTYTPDPGYVGPDSFTFYVSDGDLYSPEATVIIDVAELVSTSIPTSLTVSSGNTAPPSASTSGGMFIVTVPSSDFDDQVFVHAWTSPENGGTNGVYAQLVSGDGSTAVGPVVLLNDSNNIDDSQVAISALIPGGVAGDVGGFVAVWIAAESGVQSIHGALFALEFDTVPAIVSTGFGFDIAGGSPSDPAVIVIPDGSGYSVSWTDGGSIFIQQFDLFGAAISDPFLLNEIGESAAHSSVGATTSGNIIAVWSANVGGAEESEIFARQYDAATQSWGPELPVNPTSGGDQIDPSVAVLSNDSYVVSWTSLGTDSGIFAQRFDASGSPQGTLIRVDGGGLANAGYSSVTGLPDGGFVVTWQSDQGTSTDVFAHRYTVDSSGITVGSSGEFQINQAADGAQALAQAAPDYLGTSFYSGWDSQTAESTWTIQGVLLGSNPAQGDSKNVVGADGNDVLVGTPLLDLLVGGGGNDLIVGLGGGDVMDGGSGHNILTGGSGMDTYSFATPLDLSHEDWIQAAKDGQVHDIITNFNASRGQDVLNISDLLTNFQNGVSNIADFVQLQESGGNTEVLINSEGTGSAETYFAIATLQGQFGLNLTDLFDNGTILAISH